MTSKLLWTNSLTSLFFAKIKAAVVSGTSVAESIQSQENNYTLIRLLLAASVIYYHSFFLSNNRTHVDWLSHALSPISGVGDLAVQAFFFLSGLFVTQSFFRDRNSAYFFTKRLLRVWPGLFVCLVITATISCLLSQPKHIFQYFGFSGLYDYILSNARFDLVWYIPGVFSGMPYESINGSIHTLPLEMKMYMVLAVVGFMGFLSRRWLIIVSGVVLLSSIIWLPDSHLKLMILNAEYSRMAAVMFFAGVVVFGIARHFTPCLYQGLILAMLGWATQNILHTVFFYLFVIWAIVYLGQNSAIRKVITPRQDLSYGMYIYGYPCQQFIVFSTSSHIDPYLLTIVSLLLTFFFAFFSWRWIEKPAIDFGHWLVSNGYQVWSKTARQLLTDQVHALRVFFCLSLLLVICISMQWWTYSYPIAPVSPLAISILDFGPKESKAGVGINVQADSSSAIWVAVDGTPGDGTFLVFAGHQLKTVSVKGHVTATVPDRMLKDPGEKQIFLEQRLFDRIARSNSVSLRVTP